MHLGLMGFLLGRHGKALRAALDAARLTALAMHLGLMGFLLGRLGKALRAALDAARLTALGHAPRPDGISSGKAW